MLLLWGFYVLFLEKENMHYVKRWYLMFSLFFALIIPLVTFSYETEAIVEAETMAPVVTQEVIAANVVNDQIAGASYPYWMFLLWGIYGIGVLVFGFRFVKHLKCLTREIKRNEQLEEPSHINVLVPDTIIPHTFLNYIFVPKKEYHEKRIPEEVLLHEKTHVSQKHTLDILFVEILQVLFWFNPLLVWIKKCIKLNHEFLADQTVLKREFSVQNYMNLLVTYPNGPHQAGFASPINYSLTKKRILMMSQQFSKKRAIARILLLLPVLLGCMLLFNNKIVAQQTNVAHVKIADNTDPDKKIKIRVKGEQITVNGTATDLSGFTKAIDEVTRQWKDDELKAAQFDIQVMNSNDQFLDKLNAAYEKTRLHISNPDGHSLIPPAPPAEPKSPKSDTSTVPAPPPVAKEPVLEEKAVPSPPKVKKYPCGGKKVTVIVPSESSVHSSSYYEQEIVEALEKAEQARAMAEEEEEMILIADAGDEHEIVILDAKKDQYAALEAVYEAKAFEIIDVERIRHEARMAQEASLQVREEAMRNAEKARLIAEERVHVHAEKVREEARKYAEKARKQAEKERQKAYKVRDKALRQAEKAREEARKAAYKAAKNAK